jgi:CheY-like chemotaxis protein
VLLVEDEADLLTVLADEFGDAGYEVTAVSSGGEALEVARVRKFDVAVTDLKMPGMDGVTTLISLHLIDPELPVIVSTGYMSEATRSVCAERGAAGVILKPFRIEDILALVARAAGGRAPPLPAHGGVT